MPQDDTEPTTELRRQLGLRSATALVVGQVIGVGIFLTPAGMARSVGSPFWLLMIWLTMGAMTLCGALCFGELAGRLPQAGGTYVYLREAFGWRTAFVYGWMSLAVVDPGLTAALGYGLAEYLGHALELSAGGRQVAAIGAIALLAGTNCLGVGLGAGVVRFLTIAKLGLLAFIALWGFLGGFGDWSRFLPFFEQRPGSDPLLGALAGGAVAAFFSFGGWWDVCKAAGDIRDPARTLPRALIIGVVLVTAAYITTSAAIVYLAPAEAAESREAFAAAVGKALFGAAGGTVLALMVAVCISSSLTSILFASPRVYYAMARDGLFFPAIARIHPTLGTPIRATVLQAGVACGLILAGSFDDILGYFVFSAVAFLGLAAAGLFVLRRRPDAEPSAARSGHPYTTLLFLAHVLGLLILLALGNPIAALGGAGVVLLGLPLSLLIARRDN